MPTSLPEPVLPESASLPWCLHHRRSVRAYLQTAVTLSDLSALLWSAQNIHLAATALGLGCVKVAGVHEDEAERALARPFGSEPIARCVLDL